MILWRYTSQVDLESQGQVILEHLYSHIRNIIFRQHFPDLVGEVHAHGQLLVYSGQHRPDYFVDYCFEALQIEVDL